MPQQVAGLRTLVSDRGKAVRWVKGANIHLTVRFLGPIPHEFVDEIGASLADGLKGFGSFKVAVQGTGVFPAATRPRVLWLGLSGEIDQLRSLEEAIHAVVGPLGFPREQREFIPHITIGRVLYPQKFTPDVTKFLHAEYTSIECPLNALHLFESRAVDRGVRYAPLATIQLKPSDREEP